MRYDLIIVGGGLVGAGLLLALQQTNLRIALIDAKEPTQDDPRLLALNYGSCEFLKHIGLWPALKEAATPIKMVHVSHQGHFGAVRLRHTDINLEVLGHVIPAKQIEIALNAALPLLPNATLYRPATLKNIQQTDELATLTLESGEILEAPIVIGADGTKSTVREQLNIPTTAFDYQQSALVVRTTLARSHQHIAYERFTKEGAIAMLPLANNECATIWTAPHAHIHSLMALSDELFLQTLQNEFGYRLGRLQRINKRYLFPLQMLRVKNAVQGCVYLLGNASHTFHPIAAQGFNLALFEVAALVSAIQEKNRKKQAILASDLAKSFEETQQQQAISIGLSHRLSRLFTNDSIVNNIVLQLGMMGLDLFTPIKKKLLEGILGRLSRVPHLLLSANE